MRIFQFPKGFLWGSATSSHQVEGNNVHNDWWEWEQAGKLREPSGKACDHWNLFREDFKLAKSIHHNAHRFSLEWSRIEPEEGKFDGEVLRHYAEVVAALRTHELEPIVTLHHFTLPLWLAKRGGWCDKQAPELFTRYAQKVFEVLGKRVRYWMTINEPEVYIFKSYLTGEWPPGEKSYEKAYVVGVHLLKAHVLAYAAMKSADPTLARDREPQIGFAKHVSVFHPCSCNSWKDRVSTWLRDVMFNHLFIKALVKGRVFYPGFFHVRLPRGQTLDFIGINYYTRNFVHHQNFRIPGIFGDICPAGEHPDVQLRNSLGWAIYPEGMYRVVKSFAKFKLPILISENGICTDRDEERTSFIHEHLWQLGRAIQEGAPVFGYLYWSLLDNFEWADGFGPHFGLVEVDYKTQARHIKPSAHEYGNICKSGLLSMED